MIVLCDYTIVLYDYMICYVMIVLYDM